MMVEKKRATEGYPDHNGFFGAGTVLEILEHIDCSGNLGKVVPSIGRGDKTVYVIECLKCNEPGKIPAVQIR